MKTCRACGVALDGRVRRSRLVQVSLDNAVYVGGVYCVEHYELARELLLEALVAVDQRAAAQHSVRVASGGGGA